MKSMYIFCTMLLLLAASSAFGARGDDIKGSKDHPLLPRMPDFFISNYKDLDYDRFEFPTRINGKNAKVPVEGHYYYFDYRLKDGAKQPGGLKIVRNVENALKKIGGKVLVQDSTEFSTIKVEKDGRETWVYVWGANNLYGLKIIEKEVMKQEITANAEAMGNDITNTGHVSIYGIYFDTGKADIKSESDAAIAEIAKLLKNNASLKIYIVGHTDNTGKFDANMKLSKDRAVSVKSALVSKHGITASRLEAHGISSLAPVESNRTEEGKAKNRRVELVEQ